MAPKFLHKRLKSENICQFTLKNNSFLVVTILNLSICT